MKAINGFALALIVILCAQGALGVFQYYKIKSLEAELTTEKSLTVSWKEKADAASTAQTAIQEQAQACLDREARNIADAGIWREIIQQSQSRDMEEGEKKGVPDDKTRRNLLDFLDEPL